MYRIRNVPAILLAAILFLFAGSFAPANATVNSSQTTITIPGNGTQVVFTYPFIIPFQSNGVTPAMTVAVTAGGVTTIIPPTGYVVTGVGNAAGGTVTYAPGGVPLATGSTISITRALDYLQTTAVNNQSFYPHTVEQVADNLDMQIQQLNTRLGASGSVTGSAITLTSGGNTWSITVDGSGNLVTSRLAGSGYVNIGAGVPVYIPNLSLGTSYANDTAAAAGGISIGELYRNGSVTQVRVN